MRACGRSHRRRRRRQARHRRRRCRLLHVRSARGPLRRLGLHRRQQRRRGPSALRGGGGGGGGGVGVRVGGRQRDAAALGAQHRRRALAHAHVGCELRLRHLHVRRLGLGHLRLGHLRRGHLRRRHRRLRVYLLGGRRGQLQVAGWLHRGLGVAAGRRGAGAGRGARWQVASNELGKVNERVVARGSLDGHGRWRLGSARRRLVARRLHLLGKARQLDAQPRTILVGLAHERARVRELRAGGRVRALQLQPLRLRRRVLGALALEELARVLQLDRQGVALLQGLARVLRRLLRIRRQLRVGVVEGLLQAARRRDLPGEALLEPADPRQRLRELHAGRAERRLHLARLLVALPDGGLLGSLARLEPLAQLVGLDLPHLDHRPGDGLHQPGRRAIHGERHAARERMELGEQRVQVVAGGLHLMGDVRGLHGRAWTSRLRAEQTPLGSPRAATPLSRCSARIQQS